MVEASSWRFRLIAIAVAFFCGVAFVASGGNPGAALLPVAAFVAVATFRLLPAGSLAVLFIFILLVVDNTSENPGMGYFRSFLYYPGLGLYVALSNLTRVPGLKMFGLEVLFALLAFFAISRTQFRSRFASDYSRPMPKELKIVCWVVLIYVVGWWALGIARGGNFSYSLLQVRVVAWTVAIPLIFFPLFNSKKFIIAVFGAILAAAFIRACVGIFYWAILMRHVLASEVGSGNYVMLHADSMLMANAFFIVVFGILAKPTFRRIAAGIPYLMLLLFFVFVNERRLAYVAIGLGCLVAVLIMGKRVRKSLMVAAVAVSPLLFGYAVVGWNSGAGWAKPVQSVRSIFEQEDSSSKSRDIENYNIIYTAKTSPIFGIGYGKGYIEVVPLPDISGSFQAYRFVPHNAILSLFMFCGVVGFSVLFLFYSLGAYLAARAARFGRDQESRWIGQVVIGVVSSYLILSFGDMGMASFQIGIQMGIAVTMAAVVVSQDRLLNREAIANEGLRVEA